MDFDRSTRGHTLILVPAPRIKRAEISEIVRLRGSIRHDIRKLTGLGHSVLSRMQKGIEIEPCATPVEIEEVEQGCCIMTRLLVDGRPVDDFS